MKLILFALFSLTMAAQVTINAPAITLDATGSAAVRAWMLGQTKGTPTKLASDAAQAATTITVESGAGLGAGSVLVIGTEMLDVTAKTGNVLTVTRAINGTTAVAYLTGVTVSEAKYKSFNQLGKQIVVDSLKTVVAQYPPLIAPVTTAQSTATATVDSSIQ